MRGGDNDERRERGRENNTQYLSFSLNKKGERMKEIRRDKEEEKRKGERGRENRTNICMQYDVCQCMLVSVKHVC